MKKTRSLSFLAVGLAALSLAFFPGTAAKRPAATTPPEFDSCTSILVGRLASADGSTMTSHSCDSGSDRTWMSIVPNRKHKPGDTAKLYLEPKLAKGPDDPERLEAGEIAQVPETFAYLNAAYPIMNEHQLAIGETTIGGRRELVSQAGMIDAPELFRLCLERAKTAREAVRVADELTALHGYNDWGECLTFADPKEVWQFEIYGTDYDMTRTLVAVNRRGETAKSPVASPFMSNDLRELLRIKRERTICSPASTYLQITQSRDWLPGPIGGVVWLGYDNPATTPHTPFYIGIDRMPGSYMVDGRRAYRRDCAWWAYRTVSKLALFRWQEMTKDVERVWKDIEDRVFPGQAKLEEEALTLYKKDPRKAKELLTTYCLDQADQAVAAYWKLADELWVKYSGNF
jgi:dipeptidase